MKSLVLWMLDSQVFCFDWDPWAMWNCQRMMIVCTVHGSYFWTLDTFLSLLSSDDCGDHAPLTPCAWSLTTGGNVSRAPATRAQAAHRDHHQLSVGSRHANFSHPWNSSELESTGDFDYFCACKYAKKIKIMHSYTFILKFIFNYGWFDLWLKKIQWRDLRPCDISSSTFWTVKFKCIHENSNVVNAIQSKVTRYLL